jgi:hypothetical protein
MRCAGRLECCHGSASVACFLEIISENVFGENEMKAEAEDLADDRLTGVEAIAAFRGESRRRTAYLLEKERIPAGKEGRIWIASKRVLREYHCRLTGGGQAV